MKTWFDSEISGLPPSPVGQSVVVALRDGSGAVLPVWAYNYIRQLEHLLASNGIAGPVQDIKLTPTEG